MGPLSFYNSVTPSKWTDYFGGCSGNRSDFLRIISLLQTSDCSNLPEWVKISRLTTQISSCLSGYERAGPSNDTAHPLYLLAQELNRHAGLRKKIWNGLSPQHRHLLHRVSPWQETLDTLSSDIAYQWLGESIRPRTDVQTLSDFEGGRLFRVQPPAVHEGQTIFPLVNHPGFYLLRTSSEPISWLSSSSLLQIEKMGRIHELFNLGALKDKKELSLNQLRMVFACYRGALCETLGLSVSMPQAMGKLGEWTIWSQDNPSLTPSTLLNEKQVRELHRFFAMEEIWGIGVLTDDKQKFQGIIKEGSLQQRGIYPLPSFCSPEKIKRNREILADFNLDEAALALWHRLEEETKKEKEMREKQLNGLRQLWTRKVISFEDLKNSSPFLYFMIRLLDTQSYRDASEIANQMLTLLATPVGPSSENKWLSLTENFLSLKHELKGAILAQAFQKMERKENPEEILQVLKQECIQLGNQLQVLELWQQSPGFQNENCATHLVEHCEEFLQEWKWLLESPITDEEKLWGQILGLKLASSLPEYDREEVNRTLHSVLHDAMMHQSSKKFWEEFQQQLSK